MNMKRGLVLTLCALAVAASGSVAHAQLGATDVALSLNLRYTDPADPTEGGQWYLVAKTGSADGIAGVSAFIQNINTAGMVLGNGGVDTLTPTSLRGYDAVTAADIGSIVATAPNSPYNGTFAGFVNVVYGQNTAVVENGSIKLDVGNGGAPGLVAQDPLRGTTFFGGAESATWNNAALLASGTFGATRPVFGVAGTTTTAANVLPVGATATPPANTSLAATNVSGVNLRVRGDSVGTLLLNTDTANVAVNTGLLRGDVNRDFKIDSADLNQILLFFNQTGKTWDQGDVTDGLAGHVEGTVNSADLNEVLLRFNTRSPGVPSGVQVSAVPEPTTAVMVLAGLFGLGGIARRRRA
jgi:hypothetical protein